MHEVFAAMARAAGNVFEPRILAVVFVPMLASIVLWMVLAWVFWDAWTGALAGALGSTAIGRWLEGWGAAWLIGYTTALLVAIALLPAIYVTALVVTEIVAMPVIVSLVGERHYGSLERRAGGTLAGGLLNAAAGIGIFAALWVVTLPLWLTGIGAVALPALLSAYLNQRVFRYDALSDHASAGEYRRVVSEGKGRLFLLGLLCAALYYVPVVNLAAPVLSALAFTHLCLGELARLRQQRRES